MKLKTFSKYSWHFSESSPPAATCSILLSLLFGVLIATFCTHLQALTTPVMIRPATLRHPPPPTTTSLPSRTWHNRSLPLSSHNHSSPPSSRHSNNWPVLPGATRAATWSRLHLWTPTRSPLFTRTSCRSQKGPQNNLSCITATFVRSAAQARRYKSIHTLYSNKLLLLSDTWCTNIVYEKSVWFFYSSYLQGYEFPFFCSSKENQLNQTCMSCYLLL